MDPLQLDLTYIQTICPVVADTEVPMYGKPSRIFSTIYRWQDWLVSAQFILLALISSLFSFCLCVVVYSFVKDFVCLDVLCTFLYSTNYNYSEGYLIYFCNLVCVRSTEIIQVDICDSCDIFTSSQIYMRYSLCFRKKWCCRFVLSQTPLSLTKVIGKCFFSFLLH
jgi:hypothetical protein